MSKRKKVMVASSSEPFPFVQRAFELIDQYCGTDKRSTFTIPDEYTASLPLIDEFFGSLSPEFLEEFCNGDQDRIEVLINTDQAGVLANNLLVDYNEICYPEI